MSCSGPILPPSTLLSFVIAADTSHVPIMNPSRSRDFIGFDTIDMFFTVLWSDAGCANECDHTVSRDLDNMRGGAGGLISRKNRTHS
jgi:hypothetical protein